MALEGAWRRVVTGIVVAAGCAIAGCGTDEAEAPEPRHPVTEVVQRLQTAFADGDVEAICRLMTPGAQNEAGEVAHSSPTTCVKDVRKVFGMIDKGAGWLDGHEPRVAGVRADEAGSAIATLQSNEWKATVPFEQVQGEWKVASFVGVGTEQLREVEDGLPTGDFPSVGNDKLVKVGTYGGYTCLPLSTEGRSPNLGGCVVRVSDRGPVPVEMLTPYGAFKFGDCYVDYRLSIDEEGRTWTDEWEVEGSSKSGCSDVNPCLEKSSGGRIRKLPWRGRVVATAEGDLLHKTNVCIRTCVGMFTGELVTRLTRDGEAWRVESNDRGATGFRLNDSLDLYGRPIRIRTAR